MKDFEKSCQGSHIDLSCEWPWSYMQQCKNVMNYKLIMQRPPGMRLFVYRDFECVHSSITVSHSRNNPLGMKGHLAEKYGELVKDLWSGSSRCLAPLKFRVSYQGS